MKLVKNAQTSVAAIASPPGSQPKSALKRRTRRSLEPPSASRKPVSVKSGSVGIEGDTTLRYVSTGIEAIGTPSA